MGSCYSGDHITEDHLHTDKTTGNIKEPQQKYRLGKVSNRLPRERGHKLVLLAVCSDSKHLVHMKVS